MTEAFKRAIIEAGLITDEDIVADGTLHRFHIHGDSRGSKNGWYVCYPDGLACGAFGSWRSGLSEKWYDSGTASLTEQEKARHRQHMRQTMLLRREEREGAQRQAALRCQQLWARAKTKVDHPYLKMKRVRPFGLRQHGGLLLIPVCTPEGDMASLQFIKPDGSKRFKSEGRTSGCYHRIGGLTDPLYICEGYATGATIHQQTGKGVVIAFNAGNLGTVAQATRSLYPETRLIIAADNDHTTPGNPGLSKGREAADLVGARVIYPKFDKGEIGTDFNDFVALRALGDG